jgi:hypothetical protein
LGYALEENMAEKLLALLQSKENRLKLDLYARYMGRETEYRV